ncbi:hypothetical protein [Noviherbaspirillum massiliense]|uniref:hypothetical protein n=1 Tax=Noviherbaspirillum massiliense TaxID=1465823 RepID=UPI00030CDB4D|nr:hypothetical protein [Noviherbaspirillum massiliense]
MHTGIESLSLRIYKRSGEYAMKAFHFTPKGAGHRHLWLGQATTAAKPENPQPHSLM